MGRGIALNRHHDKRIRKKAEWILVNSWGHEEIDERKVGITASTHGKPCSCMACGNPRKYFGEVTVQEKRHCMGNL